MQTLRGNLLALMILGVVLFLQYRLWFEQGGLRDMWQLKRSLKEQAVETDKLKQRNDELQFQIERLQSSKDGTEARARNELGMVKKGETFYQIVK